MEVDVEVYGGGLVCGGFVGCLVYGFGGVGGWCVVVGGVLFDGVLDVVCGDGEGVVLLGGVVDGYGVFGFVLVFGVLLLDMGWGYWFFLVVLFVVDGMFVVDLLCGWKFRCCCGSGCCFWSGCC